MKEWQDFEQYEEAFARAINAHWAKAMTRSEFLDLKRDLQEAGVEVPGGSPTCGSCILRMLTIGGRWYFKEKKKAQEREKAINTYRINHGKKEC